VRDDRPVSPFSPLRGSACLEFGRKFSSHFHPIGLERWCEMSATFAARVDGPSMLDIDIEQQNSMLAVFTSMPVRDDTTTFPGRILSRLSSMASCD
jgi:hypothetical protein